MRSSVIMVKNEGKEKLSFQLEAKEWTQDSSGKDVYSETRDLIFFPKIMSIDPGQEGLVRVGAKIPITASERTYRLFIEELPAATQQAPRAGAQINVLIRFGEPIFVQPLKPQDSLAIEAGALTKGALTFSVRNTGNRHQVVQGIRIRGTDAAGAEAYALTLADRYLLAGTLKTYTTSIAPEICTKLVDVQVEAKTDKATAKHKVDVTRAMCP